MPLLLDADLEGIEAAAIIRDCAQPGSRDRCSWHRPSCSRRRSCRRYPTSTCMTLMDPPSCEHFVSGADRRVLMPSKLLPRHWKPGIGIGVEGIQRTFSVLAVSDGSGELEPVELVVRVPQAHLPSVVFAEVHRADEAEDLGRIVADHVPAPAFTRLVTAAADELAPLKTCTAAGPAAGGKTSTAGCPRK